MRFKYVLLSVSANSDEVRGRLCPAMLTRNGGAASARASPLVCARLETNLASPEFIRFSSRVCQQYDYCLTSECENHQAHSCQTTGHAQRSMDNGFEALLIMELRSMPMRAGLGYGINSSSLQMHSGHDY
jgi:hypothetical protein